MSSAIKFDIQKFDGVINFSRWQVRMNAILTQHGLKKALLGKEKKPSTMKDEDWQEFDEKALTAIQLCLSDEVLDQVLSEKTAEALWTRLQDLYLKKSLANRLILKQRLFLLRMQEGIPINSHISEFTSIINELDKIEVKIEDEDQALLLLCSLPSSFKNFREAIIYGGKDTLKVNEVKEHLLNKDKIDRQLVGDPITNDSSALFLKEKEKGKSSTKTCGYCHVYGHHISECRKKKKADKRKQKRSSDNSDEDETLILDLVGDEEPSILYVVDVSDEGKYISTSLDNDHGVSKAAQFDKSPLSKRGTLSSSSSSSSSSPSEAHTEMQRDVVESPLSGAQARSDDDSGPSPAGAQEISPDPYPFGDACSPPFYADAAGDRWVIKFRRGLNLFDPIKI